MDEAPQPASLRPSPASAPEPSQEARTAQHDGSPAGSGPPPTARGRVSAWDERASSWIGVGWPHPAWFSRPLGWVSVTGNYGLVWYVCALAWSWAAAGGAELVARRFAYASGAVFACQGVTFFVKLGVNRRRPVEKDPSGGEHIRLPRSPSFPSSHASMSATAVVSLGVLYPSWVAAFAGLAIVLAFSRVYLRVHYVLDVLVGLLLGAAFGIAVVLIIPPP